MREAISLFADMPEKTVVAWTAVISGHAAAGEHAAALEVFRRMLLSKQKPDHITILSILPSCSSLGALETGRWVHTFAGKNGFLKESKLWNSLVEMYAACGSIDEARQMFDQMPSKDVVSWTSMISGLARHGRAEEAVKLFEKMQSSGEASPNGVTLLAVLYACAHSGMITKGLEIFSSVTDVDLQIEHYGCLVDLLCRGGRIRRALEVIGEMPMKPDAGIWGSLVCACRGDEDADVAAMAAERLMEFETESAGNCVMVSNLCAAAGKWEIVGRLRNSMRRRRVSKTPGCSSIEVGNSVKEFVAGLNSGDEFCEIYDVLGILVAQIMNDEDEDLLGVGSDFSP